MISGVSSAGQQAIALGQQQLRQASNVVAQNGVSDLRQLTEAMVAAQTAQLQVEAGAKMIAAGNEALGSIIDAFA